ncbi:MAG: AMP-binding protein [Aquamicrobium sp.]|nr:AMP-binding protein [Aquamicrobium sp.]
MGVTSLFERGASLYGDRTCFIEGERRRSYAEVRAERDRIAYQLRAAGLVAGDKVALLSPNCIEAFEFMFAVYRAGLVFVPLSATALASEHTHILGHCEVAAIGVHPDLAEHAGALQDECPMLRHVFELGKVAGEGGALETLHEDTDTVVSIYSTGGTTGLPKGVEFSSLTWEAMSANFLASLPVSEPPTYLVSTPMTHASGTISVPLFALGATVVILPAFAPGAVLDAIEQHRVSHLWLPPTAIYMLLEEPGLRRRDLSSMECFMYSAAPMAVAKLRTCLEVFGPVMVQIWGQTEAPCFCTCLPQAEHEPNSPERAHRLASCGRPMPFSPMAILDDDGVEVPRGTMGELAVTGNVVMRGYHRNPKATAETIVNGWLLSGDVGYQDEDGYIYIVDRKKEMLISGGYNVYPAEVERVILSHPMVQDCAVIGIPDDKWGEAVTAIVELRPDAAADAQEIIALCRKELGAVKAPKAVEFRSTLPRTPVGKVDRKAIRAPFWEGISRRI